MLKRFSGILLLLLLLCGVSAAGGDSDSEGRKVVLDASRSVDPEGHALSYEWKQVSGPVVVLYESTGPKPYFRAVQPGVYVFLVRVSDGEDFSPWKKVTVEVKGANRPPVAVADRNLQARAGRYFILDARSSRDPEGQPLSFRWQQVMGPEPLLPEEGSEQAALRLRASRAGSYVFRLRVSDGALWSDPAEVRVDVLPPNQPPEAVIRSDLEVYLPEPVEVNRRPIAVVKPGGTYSPGKWVILDGSASYDLDGEALGYFWYQDSGPFVRELHPVKGMSIVRFRGEEPGEYRFHLVVSDGTKDSEPAPITVRIVSDNQPPDVAVRDDLVGSVGREVVLDATGTSDPDGDELEFHWRQKSGPRIRNFFIFRDTDQAKVAFTPREPGTYVVSLSVSDNSNEPVERQVTVKVTPRNRPPEILAPDKVILRPGRDEPVPLEVSDPDGDELRADFRVLDGRGIRITGEGAGPFRAMAGSPGRYEVRFFFRDGLGGAAKKDIVFHAMDPSNLPVLEIEGPETAVLFEVVDLAADLRGHENHIRSWHWRQQSGPAVFILPSSSDKQILQFAAPAPGVYELTVSAALKSGRSLTAEKRLTIAAGGVDMSPEEAVRMITSADSAQRARAAALLCSTGGGGLSRLEGISLEGLTADATRDIRALIIYLKRQTGKAVPHGD